MMADTRAGLDSRPAAVVSVLRSIHEGSAGLGTRLLVSLVIGCLVGSAACVVCSFMAVLYPPPWRSGTALTEFHVSDLVGFTCSVLASAVYLLPLIWIWSRWTGRLRFDQRRPIMRGVAWTAVLWLPALLLYIIIDEIFSGDEEVLMSAVLFAAGAGTLWLWIRLDWRYLQGRELHGPAGVIDLRCPECQYSMVGLKQARCPECGREYTLDELVRRQDFRVLRLSSPPPQRQSA